MRAMTFTNWVSLLSACLALGAWVTDARAQGTTVAIGGALQEGNHAVWRHLVQLVQHASGPDERACYSVVTIASTEPDAAFARVAANLARHGGRTQHLHAGPRIEGQTAPPQPAAAMAAPETLAALGRCRGVYMTGGAQARLLDTLLPQGRATPLLQAMRELWRAGGVVAGSSAGAAVLSEVVFRDAPDPLAVMKGRLREGAEWDRGFGFTPAGVVVDQHAVRRGRVARLLPLMQAQRATLGVAVEENSAAQFQGQEVLALGARGLLIADLGSATTVPGAAFNLQGATLHWLESGDRFDLTTRSVKPSAAKLAATLLRPLDPAHRGYLRGEWFYADMLGDGVIVTAMTRLLDGDQRELRGMAFAARPPPDDPSPDLAFEWRLWLDDATRGWLVTSPESYTLSGVRLDIVPMQLQRPLLRPLLPSLSSAARSP
jgi:cyanophycinase